MYTDAGTPADGGERAAARGVGARGAPVRFIDAFFDDGKISILMEFADGGCSTT